MLRVASHAHGTVHAFLRDPSDANSFEMRRLAALRDACISKLSPIDAERFAALIVPTDADKPCVGDCRCITGGIGGDA